MTKKQKTKRLVKELNKKSSELLSIVNTMVENAFKSGVKFENERIGNFDVTDTLPENVKSKLKKRFLLKHLHPQVFEEKED